MDRVTLLLFGVLAIAPCACSASTGAEPVAISQTPQLRNWQEFVAEASRRFRLPKAWIYAVMDAESGGNTMRDGHPITSSAGAVGLMQVMPGTYAEMRVEHGLGPDPHDPRDNILAGTAYLRAMYDRFGFPGLFAAYNAGPARYDDHLQHGKLLPRETVDYLKQLKAAGVSGDDIDKSNGKSVAPKAQNAPSGRSLFFLQDGIRARARNADLFVPLGKEGGLPKEPDH
ncbi:MULTISPECIES: lytic transglycosylase domain-containing protein [unclassified Mesorhizobium]|uniref:lytic transglycosylase domain-containing protein n=1 Tax=unclassified Mesorhizobium TaxID=325217 RepID=UPI000F76435F|nr:MULTISPECIES: lytic transglycosylase domain-containing protein [unclassified Mesorhizobium]TGP56593.1 lytic transglycosylase domain-containing protein [bacterium M00.F.Ca.ET.230.01.1.1]TGP74945.1 lytic transglycosylase domain-containing protein [bacterium M00.F.Ca.ET.227.01.1.1]TGP85272.1 lytic transglycosylase domain-containing protein [bacterium M00.F.Ca.ET.221.01.1.1]TGP89698.1 lytic transglycosylase domain-containing protein [bacterium M00.F.Ca.ET.222.01.1.1]TGT67801.1 lytic transglycos